MKPKKKSNNEDYIKAIKKADREIELENNPGFKSKTKVHKSDKDYDRKRFKRGDYDNE